MYRDHCRITQNSRIDTPISYRVYDKVTYAKGLTMNITTTTTKQRLQWITYPTTTGRGTYSVNVLGHEYSVRYNLGGYWDCLIDGVEIALRVTKELAFEYFQSIADKV